MSVNLIEMLQDQLGDTVMSQAGKFLGENDSIVKSAMGAALPTILGSLITKSATPSGSKGLMDMLSSGGHDGSIFDNLGSMMDGGDATSGLMNAGNGILKGLMGNKMGGIIDIIASVSGMKKSNSSSLMSMAAPIVMGMVGRYVKNKAMDAVGLSKFLGGQSKHVASALPAGMGDLMGFSAGNMGNVGDNVKKMATAATGQVETAAAAGGSWLSKLLPLAFIAVLGAGAYWYFTGNSAMDVVGDAAGTVTGAVGDVAGAAGDVAGAAAGAVGDAAGAVGDVAGDAAGAVGDAAGAGGNAAAGAAGAVASAAEGAVDAATAAATKALSGVMFATGPVGEKFSAFLASGKTSDEAFRFNNLNFAIGSANIDAASMSEIDNLAAVLNAYPNVTIEVSGHTDNTGNAAKNKTLSEARAKSVAARLTAKGIAANRITTVGYGAEMPAASNETAEGKKQNRRIEVKRTK